MLAVALVGGDVIDDDDLIALARVIAEHRREEGLSPGVWTEPDFILHEAGGPPLIRYPGHGRETHAGRVADEPEDSPQCSRPGLKGDVVGELRVHVCARFRVGHGNSTSLRRPAFAYRNRPTRFD